MSIDHGAEMEWIEGAKKETAENEALRSMEGLQEEFLKNYQGDVFKITAEDLERYKEVSVGYLQTVPKEKQLQYLSSIAGQIRATPYPEEAAA